MYLVVNTSFNMRLWNVAFHKTRASCSYFNKLIRPLNAAMPYMCNNPLNMNCVVLCYHVISSSVGILNFETKTGYQQPPKFVGVTLILHLNSHIYKREPGPNINSLVPTRQVRGSSSYIVALL